MKKLYDECDVKWCYAVYVSLYEWDCNAMNKVLYIEPVAIR